MTVLGANGDMVALCGVDIVVIGLFDERAIWEVLGMEGVSGFAGIDSRLDNSMPS